ncbi:MAG: endonuclease/exonuclease/phosphatase family protein [Myxococcales bacterium]|nr:endonuclease/exonuclease/phosphatase family protein [Myxococcales bacterium]
MKAHGPLRLMTYNVRVGVESSLAEIAAAVRAAGVPDLLAFQEIGVDWNMGERVDQPRVLADALGLAHVAFAGALTDDRGGRFGVALASRWPLDAIEVIPLPRDTDEQRVLLRCRVGAPTSLTAFVTHLSIHAHERAAQAAQIGAAAAAVDGPIVVMGDLNDRPGTPPIEAARGALIDCFDALGEGPPETFSVADPHRRIDYVFVGGGLVPGGPARVVRAARASDHFPLAAAAVFVPERAA